MKENIVIIETRRSSPLRNILRIGTYVCLFYLFLIWSGVDLNQFNNAYNLFLRKDIQRTDKRVILSNGVTMPILGAGTWQYDDETAEKSVFASLEAGYRHIDTAYNYFNQKGVANGIKKFLNKHPEVSRYDIFVTTKVPGCGSYGVSYENCGDDTHDIIQTNLDLLGFSHVDLILIHFPPKNEGCGPESCEALRHQYKALQHAFMNKRTRSIGVSNFCQECIDCIMSWPEIYILPVVNQLEYHIGMGTDPEGIVSYSESQGMVVQAYSPLGNNNPELIKGEDISKIARNHGKSVAQVSLKWIIENDITLLSKSSNPVHMKQNLDMFSWNLNEDEMEYLNGKKEPAAEPLC